MHIMHGVQRCRSERGRQIVFASLQHAGADALLQVRVLWCDVEGGGVMHSKTIAGSMIVGGLMAVIVFGQMASWAGGKICNPSQDWYYDCIGWIGAIGAFGGIAAFAWGAKLFAAK